jgi:hypothetical protein
MRADVFDALRVENGRIVEHRGVPDRLGTPFQLGLAQPPTARRLLKRIVAARARGAREARALGPGCC